MKTFLQINPKRILAFVGLAGILGLTGTAMAQTHIGRVYANYQNYNGSHLILGSNTTARPANALFTTNLHDSSTLSVSGVAATETQYLQFRDGSNNPISLPTGTTVHIKVSASAGLLGLNVAGLLGTTTLGTFTNLAGTAGNATASEIEVTSSSSNLASLLSGAGTDEVIFKTTAASNGVYLKLAALVGAGYSADLFHAYIYDELPGSIGCPEPIDWSFGTGKGLADALGTLSTVTNPSSAIDGDENTAATMTTNVAANTAFFTAILNTPAKAGDSVRIILNNPNPGLINLALLSGLTIQAYDGADAVGTKILGNSALITLQLLPGSTNKNVITAVVNGAPGTTFDRIKIENGGVADLSSILGNGALNIYEIGVKVAAPTITSGTLNKTVYKGNSVDLNAFVTPNASADPIVWYDDSIGGSVVASPLTAATSRTLYAASQRDGCTDASGRTQLNLKVATPASPGLTSATVGTPYSQQITVEADPSNPLPLPPSYTFTVISSSTTLAQPVGSYPFGMYAMNAQSATFAAGPMAVANNNLFASTPIGHGLSMDENGLVTGTPDAVGTVNFTIGVFDNANNLDAGTFDKTIGIDAALPTNLSDFNVNLDANKNAVLKWKTESEQNYVRFDVLRSNDGSKFTKIGDVKAVGNSSSVNNYQFTDKNPGAKSYYKLNIVTANDGISTSDVVSISGGKIAGFSISPNPASNDITITGIDNDDIASVNIYDASGRLVQSAAQGSINVHSLSAGIYFVTVVQKDGTKSNSKFLKK